MYCITGTRSGAYACRAILSAAAAVTCTLMIPHIIIFFATDNYFAKEMANSSRLEVLPFLYAMGLIYDETNEIGYIYISLQSTCLHSNGILEI